MYPMDFLSGSFEFETTITRDNDDVYTASSNGYKAKHTSRDQAVNDLNRLLNDAMESGKLKPSGQ